MFLRRLFALFAASSLVLASFAFFCGRMGMASVSMGMDGSSMPSAQMTMDCAGHPGTCAGDQMGGLLQSIPVSLVDEILFLMVLVAVVVLFVRPLVDLRAAREAFSSFTHQRLKRLQWLQSRSDLVSAFSRGILNSKRYA